MAVRGTKTNGIGTVIGTDITETETGIGTGPGTGIRMRDIEITGKGTRIVMNADGPVLVPVPANDVQQVRRDLCNLQQQKKRLHRLQKIKK
jgi:hypothetical protein